MSDYTETKAGKYIVRKYNNGTEEWYLNGWCHREDGPAIKYADGTELWYKNGQLHREDGPALKYPNGSKFHFLNEIMIYSKIEYKLIPVLLRYKIIYDKL